MFPTADIFCESDLTAEQERYLDVMYLSYLATALWSSTDDDGKLLDEKHDVDDIDGTPGRDDCKAFMLANQADLEGMKASQAGHDFWLTRNRHGAGFWDRGLGTKGKRLTDAAHAYGDSDAYIGDDGKVHLS